MPRSITPPATISCISDRSASNEHYYRHIEIMPKLGEVAGLEWGTGSYI